MANEAVVKFKYVTTGSKISSPESGALYFSQTNKHLYVEDNLVADGNSSSIADTYSESSTYSKGDIVWKDNVLKIYDGSNFVETNICNQFTNQGNTSVVSIRLSTKDGQSAKGQKIFVFDGDNVIYQSTYSGSTSIFRLPKNNTYTVVVSDTLINHFNPTPNFVSINTSEDVSISIVYSDLTNSELSDVPYILDAYKSGKVSSSELIKLSFNDTWINKSTSQSYDISWKIYDVVSGYYDDSNQMHVITSYDPIPSGKSEHVIAILGWKYSYPSNVQMSSSTSTYSTSNIHTLLNDTGSNSFISGCSDNVMSLICNSLIYGITGDNVIEPTSCKFFVQSSPEFYGTYTMEGVEGNALQYWKERSEFTSPSNLPSAGRMIYQSSASQHPVPCWTRSMSSSNFKYIDTFGSVQLSAPSEYFSFIPTCIVKGSDWEYPVKISQKLRITQVLKAIKSEELLTIE